MYPKTAFYNLFLNIMTREEVLMRLKTILEGSRTETLFFINAHCFNIAWRDESYRKALYNSNLVLNDGIGIELGALISGIKLKDNLNGTDLIPEILQLARNQNKKVYFLGAKPGIAYQAAQNASKKVRGIQIAGIQDGYFNAEREKEIIKEINELKIDLLIVGMGVPVQELWIQKNLENLGSCKLIVAGGAILDFMAGNVKRAPDWMKKAKIEWVFRLYLEPGRLWKRYLVGNFLFFWYILNYKLSKKT
jgi:N-acetylglucosaminyldiphosphoundecaprenol N-acetyl-beta-D-mannosaminyltransferase